MKTGVIKLQDIQNALEEIPRTAFLGRECGTQVVGRSIPAKHVAAQFLKPLIGQRPHRALHIGTGSGYLDALLASLCEEVISVEKNPLLVDIAKKKMKELSIGNVQIHHHDGNKGLAQFAPYDVIVIGSKDIQDIAPFEEQLSDLGILICLEGTERRHFTLKAYQHYRDRLELVATDEIDFSRHSGDILLELGLIEENALKKAIKKAHEKRIPVIDELRRTVKMDDPETYNTLAQRHSLPFFKSDELLRKVSANLFKKVSKAYLSHQHLLPLYIENGKIVVATYDPEADTRELSSLYDGNDIELVIITPADFRRLWSIMDLHLEQPLKAAELTASVNEAEEPPLFNEHDLESKDVINNARLLTLYDSILLDAICENASDIHIEVYSNTVRVRLRVDGELHDLTHYTISLNEYDGLVNVIKIKADLDIAERRLPQGGRSQASFNGANFDLRIQVQPSLHGEDVIIRLLPQSTELISMEDLGLSKNVVYEYRRALNNPYGMVLVTGPTGSGKSTTLYAGLQELAADGTRKVITIEDPIEYSIKGIQQCEILPAKDFHFAKAMRTFVREDPDVIMVGEIRDSETALEAVRASQTGHVVLSTLHANDTTDSLQRLYDLGVHPNSIANELTAIISQRLTKRICSHCKEEIEPNTDILKELYPDGDYPEQKYYAGKGCEICRQKGTKGRIAAIEFLGINKALKKAIADATSSIGFRDLALKEGQLMTLRDHALAMVKEGIISLDEIIRLLPTDKMADERKQLD